MTNPDFGRDRTTVVSPTDAKQGNKKRMNLRVLFGSLIGITILGAILLTVFFKATPPGMDATPTGAEAPATTAPAEPAPAAPAPEATPDAATPPASTPPATPPTATEPDPAPAAPTEPAPAPAPAP